MEAVTSTVFSNASILPSTWDLLLVVPRLAERAGSFVVNMPEAMDNIAGKIWSGGSVIADATGQQIVNSTISNTSAAASLAQSTAAALDAAFSEAWREGAEDAATSSVFGLAMETLGRLKSFGGIFSYLTSRWALVTFTVAIILNRAQFFASVRHHFRLPWYTRLAFYIVPILALLTQMQYILQAMRCQTSPDFAELRYGDPSKQFAIDFAGEGGFLYDLASTLLFWQDDAQACAARSMSLTAVDGDRSELRGSLSLLFWFFMTLCTGQVFETMCCAMQGNQPMPETGMTIFEHSLAFAECEAMISSALGFGFFGLPKSEGGSRSADSTGPLFTRTEILQRLNVPPEVLLVCLISSLSHMSSGILAVLGIRHRVRLVNTGIWGCCYMAAFIWSFSKVLLSPIDHITDLGVLRFPTVCIVGFIPHLLILMGIMICAVIYTIALCATALSAPEHVAHGLSLRQRFSWAYHNLQANVQFSSASSIRIKMSEDFYTTLLKVGFNILTAASEAVYLNEGNRIQVAQMTWLERKRIDELSASMGRRAAPPVPSELLGDIAQGVDFFDQQHGVISQSPYARERRSRTKTGDGRANARELESGLGISQRRNRMQLTYDFMSGIFWLLVSLEAQLTINMLNKLGVEYRPNWLLKAAGTTSRPHRVHDLTETSRSKNRDFWMIGPTGQLTLPDDDEVDVETETRKRMQSFGTYTNEERLSEHIYKWWTIGGWFGNVDESGEFEAAEVDDDDTTSVISMSESTQSADEWSDIEESGRRTPTQENPYGLSRDSTPAPHEGGLELSDLARLLNPRTAAERDEARLLSLSLQSDRPMTRSQFRRSTNQDKAQILQGLRRNTPSNTDYEEERDLEEFILTQRAKEKPKPTGAAETWESGAEGMGAGGPQCVVCQSTPRTILVWPCGCLSMCDDCRVGLAARNYTKCICCRTDVAAYSRLFVP